MPTNTHYPCGSLIIAGIPGTTLDRETAELIRQYGVGNFIIFKRNAQKGPEALKNLCESLKEACLDAGIGPPIISVDQEGGTVQRLNKPFWKKLPSAQEAGEVQDPEAAATALAVETAEMLRQVGINMNMAPVLDVAGPASDGVLKGRCFGDNPSDVAAAGTVYINTLQENGIAAVAKHFPGIGLVQEDPHMHRPVVEADPKTIQENLVPFQHAVKSGVSSVMTSHVIYQHLDKDVPASFSPIIAREILREQMGFDGVLMTDDLEMGGITRYGSVEESALRAFVAGHDMFLVCHSPELIKATVKVLDDACKSKKISTTRLETSLFRVSRLKERFCQQA